MLYPDLMQDYADASGVQWFLLSIRKDDSTLWSSCGHWWAVCGDGVLPSDADAIVVPRERAQAIFYSEPFYAAGSA